ncbi:MAG: two-component system activity regulator YycH [Candidatus Cohnella colombiensis]|uniref:Two-component system activity regulator YycH n=1 Tax=Candidatus Cohnella colombiensis TaxID=3121368 RepID=A0AA95EWL1_9BACL|nr:MAG: two-component system activity regulator YycH [Cohnella sp.]
MMEKLKTIFLVLLVALSLVQSYFLAYSMPNLDAKAKSELDYVKTEPLGEEEVVNNLISPELLILHMGEDKHTVFYPSTQPYYDIILKKLQDRVFKGIQLEASNTVNWDQVRQEDQGVELRFGRAVPFELLQRVFKIEGNFVLSQDAIERIWIFSSKGREEVRTFFFSEDGRRVYEATRADLTVGDVEGYVGFGQFWDAYETDNGQLYYPTKPISRLLEIQVNYDRYSTDQMQANLFFDPNTTQSIPERLDTPLFYTDGKRGLSVEPASGWMTYTDPVAPTNSENDYIENVLAAVTFINQHGGWNGKHMLAQETVLEGESTIRFQQYYDQLPIVSSAALNIGYMQLVLQQGDVSSYERSLLVLGTQVTNKRSRQLLGGEPLKLLLAQAQASGRKVKALFPAYKPSFIDDQLSLNLVWAIRLDNGEVAILAESSPILS